MSKWDGDRYEVVNTVSGEVRYVYAFNDMHAKAIATKVGNVRKEVTDCLWMSDLVATKVNENNTN